ncbi:MAG: transcription antitermination factor NusB [Saprospiraceae bacterium]|nr:transcription antitermination factor NusB [Saprospiraceae bacterium]
MQVLYAVSRDSELTLADAHKRYKDSVRAAIKLYMFNLLYLSKSAEYSIKDAERRKAKHLPSAEDKAFSPKLYRNPLADSLTRNTKVAAYYKHDDMEVLINEDIIRRLYTEFAKTDEYREFVMTARPVDEHYIDMWLELYKVLLRDEAFNELLEDAYPNWIDDESLIIGAVKKTLKSMPLQENFYEAYLPSDEAVREFGEALLEKVITLDKELTEIIEPMLQNWDADRVAIIDMILLKMAVGELTAFPTIPTKVTLNEYVEIAKLYSTDKSQEFINGILDRLMKKLQADGDIAKIGRGLVED